jgi:hypothetical protein
VLSAWLRLLTTLLHLIYLCQPLLGFLVLFSLLLKGLRPVPGQGIEHHCTHGEAKLRPKRVACSVCVAVAVTGAEMELFFYKMETNMRTSPARRSWRRGPRCSTPSRTAAKTGKNNFEVP